MHSLDEIFSWKAHLLTKGVNIDDSIEFPDSISAKKIHLYAHSSSKHQGSIPDDVLLDHRLICRIRYQPDSEFILEKKESAYLIRNSLNNTSIAVSFVSKAKFSDIQVSGYTLSSICSFLGKDLLGITPSNYCFYFQNGKQCKFCEILPTFKKEVEFRKTFKSLETIEQAIIAALEAEEHLRFVAITTGNIHSYDATVDYFIEIGQRLKGHPSFTRATQVLATLMPPDDLSKISAMRESGMTKIYFPLEVYNKNHFQTVCPGKADYGYERIIKALEEAVKVFGPGNVYTNFVYGIQSLNSSLDPKSYDATKENTLALDAVKAMLSLSVIPAFTLYHYAGYNAIGTIRLDSEATESFFREWGMLVHKAGIVPKGQEAVLFGPNSLSNTLFNDGYILAKQKETL
jgi:hypothetical protein